MGVDVRMTVRVKTGRLNDQEVRSLAGRLCATVGADKFFIIAPPENRSGSSPTDKYFAEQYPQGRHALTINHETAGSALAEITEYDEGCGSYDEIREQLQAVDPTSPVHSQDGPYIIGEPNEQFLTAHLNTRYYGVGYERGSWPTIRSTIEFLEYALPGCEVWYGGDSSGVEAVHFGRAKRDEMTEHFLSHGHEPYRGYSLFRQTGRTCSFCGGKTMHNTGGGGDKTFWDCDGCGKQEIVSPLKTVIVPAGGDFFEASRKFDAA